MKKFISALVALALCVAPVCAATPDGEDFALTLVCDSETVEVGDQFLVRVLIDGEDFKYLTYSVCGTFDNEIAQLVAPVYKDDGFSIIYNEFSNETGEFQFDAADIQKISGSSDPLVISLLFKATAEGTFRLNFGIDSKKPVLGRANVTDDNYEYNFSTEALEIAVSPDTDNTQTVIIAEKENPTPYNDMGGYSWAEISVGALAKLGILDGFCTDSFLPAQNITRGEFTALLVRSLKLEGTTEGFADVNDDYPFAKELKTAKKTAVALGDGNGNFNPDSPVTRQEMCTLVFRALSYKHKMKPMENAEEYLSAFAHGDEIAPYAREAVAVVSRANILTRDDNQSFKPEATVKRAYAASVLERVIIHNKLVR